MAWGVIFDMDGVMVLTEQAHWHAWKAVADDRGVALTYETFLACFGRVNDDCVRIMFGEGVPRLESSRIAEAKEHAFRDVIRDRVPLAPGLVDLLRSLHELECRVAVGSSAPPENVDLVLDAGGIRGYFAAAIDGSRVKRGKPAPDAFLLAAEAMGVRAERCAVVEDAPAGIQAARAAGMAAVAVATTHSAADLLHAGADEVFDGVAALSARGLLASATGPRR